MRPIFFHWSTDISSIKRRSPCIASSKVRYRQILLAVSTHIIIPRSSQTLISKYKLCQPSYAFAMVDSRQSSVVVTQTTPVRRVLVSRRAVFVADPRRGTSTTYSSYAIEKSTFFQVDCRRTMAGESKLETLKARRAS